MAYFPHTPEDQRAMLAAIGVEKLDDLFRGIPSAIRLKRPLQVPPRRTEAEILSEMERLALRNRRFDDKPCFLGAGSYLRFIPAAVDYLSSRGEFNTAYTPYQPEVSQGTLQAIFEYQSMLCRLTGMEIANASMYEAGTALAESVLMAYAIREGTRKVVVSEGVHPEYLRVLRTYLKNHPLELETVSLKDGLTPVKELEARAGLDTAALVIQSPNFLGALEEGALVGRFLQSRPEEARPFLIVVADPISLAAVEPPGSYGADVVVGDGQQLGNYPAYGGPTFGFFTTRMSHVRKVPGRIVGETRDRDGKRGYVLTFQTREQHIRRERATSNICTNQGLLSLRGAMYLSLLGERGLREVAGASIRMASFARELLSRIPGVERTTTERHLFEFPLRLPIDAEVAYDRLAEAGIIGGFPLGRFYPEKKREMLFAFTELTRKEHVERLALELKKVLEKAPALSSRR